MKRLKGKIREGDYSGRDKIVLEEKIWDSWCNKVTINGKIELDIELSQTAKKAKEEKDKEIEGKRSGTDRKEKG